MKVLWRKEPLSPVEIELLVALRSDHFQAAFRDSSSSVAFRVAFHATGDFYRSCASAICTLGVKHAPIADSFDFLEKTPPSLPERVPGWGNGFIKGEHDPLFLHTREALEVANKEMFDKITSITEHLHSTGLDIYPNPGCWTAATAITLGANAQTANFLFLSPRIDAWAAMIQPTQPTP